MELRLGRRRGGGSPRLGLLAPAPRVHDVAYALRWFAPLRPDPEALDWHHFPEVPDRRSRVAAFLDAYGPLPAFDVTEMVASRAEATSRSSGRWPTRAWSRSAPGSRRAAWTASATRCAGSATTAGSGPDGRLEALGQPRWQRLLAVGPPGLHTRPERLHALGVLGCQSLHQVGSLGRGERLPGRARAVSLLARVAVGPGRRAGLPGLGLFASPPADRVGRGRGPSRRPPRRCRARNRADPAAAARTAPATSTASQLFTSTL